MSAATPRRPGRNEPCRCGSGRKYKHCCLVKDEAEVRAAHAKAAAEAPAPSTEAARHAPPPKPQTHQPWRRANTHGFQRIRAPRKVGN